MITQLGSILCFVLGYAAFVISLIFFYKSITVAHNQRGDNQIGCITGLVFSAVLYILAFYYEGVITS